MRKYYRRKRATLAAKVKKIQKVLSKRKPELKYAYASAIDTTVNNNPSNFLIPYRNVNTGINDFQQRIGDKIVARNVNVKGFITLPAGGNGSIFRCVAFIYKKNPDAITVTPATVWNLYMESVTMNTVNAVNAFNDWDNKRSFHLVYDKSIVLNPNVSTLATISKFNFNIKIPKSYQKVDYNAGTAFPSSNELIIGFISNTDDVLLYTYQWRFTYTDP